MTRMERIELVRVLIERFNQADLDGVLSCYADDVDYYEVGGRRYRGRDQLRPYLERYFAAWDNRWRITRAHSLFDADDEVVAFWDVEMRPRKQGRASRTASGMELVGFRGDEIASDWLYFDTGQMR